MDLRELPSRAFARHPWETARAKFFLRLLRDHVKGEALSILDFGSGDGFFARTLAQTWPAAAKVVCFDPAYPPERVPSDAQEAKVSYTREKPRALCDVLLLLDVLEHDANDQATLHEALSCLRPGGWLLMSAPAHAMLFTHHDELLGHKRRYSSAALRALADNEDVVPVEQGQLFASLLVPRALTKLTETVRPRIPDAAATAAHVDTSAGTWNHGRLLTRTAEAALNLDGRMTRALGRLRLPVPGLSTWLLARKQ
jgi:2-polyprenyl-3-methyl-5-hydroxy-6-metoxy-1,4-benzoquinol methylase